ncbi:MAG: hypothetical protein ACUVQZ_07975 [Candidatus Caldatribacteriaceae bacterium]
MRKLTMIMVGFFLVGMVLLSGCSFSNPVPQNVIKARDWGIEQDRREGINVPQGVNWEAENLTPPLLVGYTNYAFTYGVFRIEVGYPVVLSPTYKVTIYEYGTVVWEGTVSELDLT